MNTVRLVRRRLAREGDGAFEPLAAAGRAARGSSAGQAEVIGLAASAAAIGPAGVARFVVV